MNPNSCNRRYFLQMTVAALTLGDLVSLVADPSPTPTKNPMKGYTIDGQTGTAGVPTPNPVTSSGPSTTMKLGLATDFSKDQVYLNFYDKGWFLIRKEGKYFALTDVCPHKGGPLILQPDNTFTCKWHHATFDGDGHVTKKPAKTDLKVYPVDVDATGQLVITLPAVVPLPPKKEPKHEHGPGTPSGTPSPAPSSAPAV